jgi:hypothetical protein
MYEEDKLVYYRRRILEERALSADAACKEAQEVHAEMSRLYEARATLIYVDQANSIVTSKR